jgi:hypothetical protein
MSICVRFNTTTLKASYYTQHRGTSIHLPSPFYQCYPTTHSAVRSGLVTILEYPQRARWHPQITDFLAMQPQYHNLLSYLNCTNPITITSFIKTPQFSFLNYFLSLHLLSISKKGFAVVILCQQPNSCTNQFFTSHASQGAQVWSPVLTSPTCRPF